MIAAAAAASSSAFVPHRHCGGALSVTKEQGLAADSRNNGEGPSSIFELVDDYWKDKKKNLDVGSLFGGIFPDAKLPSVPNLIDVLLKNEKGSAAIERVEDFDFDLANEIEAALALANDVAGDQQFDYREQRQQRPTTSDPIISNFNSAKSVDAATAAAAKAWLDGMSSDSISTSDVITSNNERRYEYPNETTDAPSRNMFFTHDSNQYNANKKEENLDTVFDSVDYDVGQYTAKENEENFGTFVGKDSYKDRFSTAAQTLADQSIRAGLEKKSVEEAYKIYKQYFENGVEAPFQKVADDENRVYISDAAFELAQSLSLDPYEIHRHKQNSCDQNSRYNDMIEEHDVRNYLDLRYEALLSSNNVLKRKPKRKSPRVNQRSYRGNTGYDIPRNEIFSEVEDNSWQSYYDKYKEMAEPSSAREVQNVKSRVPSASDQQRPTRQRRNARRQIFSVQPPPDPRQYQEPNLPKIGQYERLTNTNYQPQKPRESHLSKLVFETKTEKVNSPHIDYPNSRMTSNSERFPFEQVNQAPDVYVDSRREQDFRQKFSRGLGTNKNYPQDRSYRETRNKNSIDVVSSGNDEDIMTYEQYNAYFAANMQMPNPAPPIVQSGHNLKGLLEDRFDRNWHKQELYNRQRYRDERLQRDMQRVLRLTHVEDRKRELENRLEQNMRQRQFQHHQQELDERLEQNIQRLSDTSQRALEKAKAWFGNHHDGNQNKFGP
jgi:hypothetical protein